MAKTGISNLREFNRWIVRATQDLVPEQAALFQKRVAFEVFRRVILKSPVGNPSLWANPGAAPPGYVGGRFRANWQIDTRLNDDSTEDVDPGGGATIAAGLSNIETQRIQPYGTIWIFNNVPYARRLEEGWSSQAPSGVVGVTLTEIAAGAIR